MAPGIMGGWTAVFGFLALAAVWGIRKTASQHSDTQTFTAVMFIFFFLLTLYNKHFPFTIKGACLNQLALV